MKTCEELLDEILLQELLWHYNNFCQKQTIPFVSHDPEEEAKHVQKMRKSFKRVIKYFGGNV